MALSAVCVGRITRATREPPRAAAALPLRRPRGVEGTGMSARLAMRAAIASSMASRACLSASASSLPNVVTSGKSGHVTSSVPLSPGVGRAAYSSAMPSLRGTLALFQARVLLDLPAPAAALFLPYPGQGQFRRPAGGPDGKMPAAALVGLKAATPRLEPPPKFGR